MKFLLKILVFLYFFSSYLYISAASLKDSLISDTQSSVGEVNGDTTGDILSPIFSWFKTEIFSLIMVVAIAVFIFIGIRFASARGNPEEFKKAWMQLIYAIIGIFFIFMAWGLVKIVSSLSL
ncbi:hypothetical protein HUU51_03570 [Candidatus Gracilibacteria bacterium]|nr:hypothetical protein [Candidatus Gracilibacteria bacterium]